MELEVRDIGALVGGAPRAGDDDGAGVSEYATDSGADASDASGDEDYLPRQTKIDVRHAC